MDTVIVENLDVLIDLVFDLYSIAIAVLGMVCFGSGVHLYRVFFHSTRTRDVI